VDRSAGNWLGLLFPFLGLSVLLLAGGPFTPPPVGTAERLLHDFEQAARVDDPGALEALCAEEAWPAAQEAAAVIRADRRWTWARTWKGLGRLGEDNHSVGRSIGDRGVLLELERTEDGWLIVAAGTS